MYAIIEDSGQQFKVSQGDVLRVDLRENAGETIEFDRVLLLADGGDVKVGAPLVAGAKVIGNVEQAEVAGPKVRSFMYRRRKGLRRRKGHRQLYTQVRITQIVA